MSRSLSTLTKAVSDAVRLRNDTRNVIRKEDINRKRAENAGEEYVSSTGKTSEELEDDLMEAEIDVDIAKEDLQRFKEEQNEQKDELPQESIDVDIAKDTPEEVKEEQNEQKDDENVSPVAGSSNDDKSDDDKMPVEVPLTLEQRRDLKRQQLMKEKEEKARLKAKAAAIKRQKEDELKRQIMKGNEMRLELAARWAMQDEDKASKAIENDIKEQERLAAETVEEERLEAEQRAAEREKQRAAEIEEQRISKLSRAERIAEGLDPLPISASTKEGADAEDGDTDSETSNHERIDLQDRTACCCTIS